MSDLTNRPDFQFLTLASQFVMQKASAFHKAQTLNSDPNENRTVTSDMKPANLSPCTGCCHPLDFYRFRRLAELVVRMAYSFSDGEILDCLGFHEEELEQIKLHALWFIQISAEEELDVLKRKQEDHALHNRSNGCGACFPGGCVLCSYIQSALRDLQCLVANKKERQDVSEEVISILTDLASDMPLTRGEIVYNLVRRVVCFDLEILYKDLCLALCEMLMREESASAMSRTGHDATASLHVPYQNPYDSTPRNKDDHNSDLPFDP